MTKILLTGLMIMILSAGCSEQPQSSGPAEKLALAVYAGDTSALVYIADEQGYFTENGLDVVSQDYEAGKLAVDALVAGEAELATATEFVFVRNVIADSELRILSTVARARTNELVARKDRGISTPGDLKGKRVGVTVGSSAEFHLGVFLTFNGLTIDDIEVVDLTPSKIVTAMINGNIDAGLVWEPNVYNIKNQLADQVISWPAQARRDFYFVIIGRSRWVEENPGRIKRFLQALVQAEQYAQENEEDAKKFIKDKFGYGSEYMDYIWERHDFIVELPQSLVLSMEDQARWLIQQQLSDREEVPNFLNYLDMAGLEAIKPEGVTLVH